VSAHARTAYLRRESRTALELAALAELPADSAPAVTLGPATADRARVALDAWRSWAERRKKLA